ncbi:hypothetical protein [Desulfatirhabdium butyrativorans]|uniref:hypothetical protein n=1 Tax=Desulfatirhabdium butyrativorans TaxID=340467 RepID=UPI00041A9672|nr:hypothetical protein [Desulfatirhabdium butyrativorans]
MKNGMIGKWIVGIALMVIMTGMASVALAGPPRGIAGFTLGDDLAKYQQRILPDTALPVRYAESITEVEVKVESGFKTGIVAYGSCAYPEKILRLKFKYADDSRDFFEELVRRLKMRYGEKAEWRGDPFQNVLAWKWSFRDANGRNLSLIVQHNRRDTDEKIGNTIKLAWMDAIEKEQLCFNKGHRQARTPKKGYAGGSGANDHQPWEILMPN